MSRFVAIVLGAVFTVSFIGIPVFAQNDKGGFSIQVAPSPIVANITPGKKSTLELRIRNTNTKPEDLKMGLRSFSISSETGEIDLGSTEPADIKDFVTFKYPTFTLQAGEWFTQSILIDTPSTAGFTYSFAVTVSRQSDENKDNSAAAIQGSVAVFTLLTVDKPGAIRQFEISKITSAKNIYEYLPATFDITFKNTGNTFVRPTGNLFIQRLSSDSDQIDALPINPSGGYILPGTTRTLTIEWNNGFPYYETPPGTTTKNLTWNWAHITDLRIGRYVAKVVAIYDDGTRDVPITAEVGFWVIPWKILIGFALIFGLIIAGIVSVLRTIYKPIKKKAKARKHAHEQDKDS